MQFFNIRKFINEWQEPIIWFPITTLALIGLFFVLPHLDPKSGVDGFGALYDLAQACLVSIVVFFFAWLYRRTYGAAVEADLIANSHYIKENHPVLFYITEKIYQVTILVICYFLFKH